MGPGYGMRRFGTGEKAPPGSIRSMFRRVLQHARGQWRILAVAFVCVIAISLLEFIVPQLTRYTIDHIIPERRFGLLLPLGGAVLGAAALLGGLRYVSAASMAAVGQRVIHRLRGDLYRHLHRLDVGFYDRRRTGDLMSRVTSDVSILQQLISSSMMQLLTDGFTFTAIALYMLWIDWQLTLLLLATFPFMLLTTRLFGRRMRASFRTVQESVADVSDHLHNTLTGIRLIKSFTAEAHEIDRFGARSRRNMEANVRVVRLRAAYEPIIDWLNYLGLAIVLVFGAWLAMREALTVGTIVAFIAYLRLLQNPIRHFSRIINTIQQSAAAYERIAEILNTEPQVADAPGAAELHLRGGEVVFAGVGFAYKTGEPVLRDFDLTLPAGQVTALVGSSGSGKTTVANLISRFYDPQAGQIVIDGQPLREVTLASLRGQIGFVSQEVVLLDGTIRDNLLYGKPDAADAELESAARAAHADAFIAAFADGYDTQIGERGIKLSGGQKQRLSIARTILKDPRIVILDEATAALDTESEQLIQEALARLLRGRTCLVIAHRLSTIRQADRIHVLEHGRIVESGNHDELLTRGGRYRQLHDLQFPQEEPAEERPMS
ncbi:ABC transporter ATP-binding protein [Paenibacillus sp. IB182496]|uniref:ABC transporter ATP-binding protein n=2 Tax=Paenibacillus sabuli TaxID=2772509 RepID=A0A927GSH9_9BACL|nr:ABC transporter ATP-binding protein [Paenibacillus sabuli]